MKVSDKKSFYFWAMAAHDSLGLSGGDRIFVELAKRWIIASQAVEIIVSEEGYKLCQKQKLSQGVEFSVLSVGIKNRMPFILIYLNTIFQAIFKSLKIIIFEKKIVNSPQTCFYSASEFWMDSIPCWLLKLRFSRSLWMAAWYQTAPNPIIGFAEGKRQNRYRLKALLYWLVQLPIKPLIDNFADFVLVNNVEEKKQFPKLRKRGGVIVLLGAVDLERITDWKKKHQLKLKSYDAVFQGRFHPQKGVLELIDIWEKVVQKKPKAKLAMIGDGPLMNQVKSKVKTLNLTKNVKLFGYVFDGNLKYAIFSRSKMVTHPAFYDSGGMAAAEAMAFGIPVIGFKLKSYESYYPQGMIKIEIGNLDEFALTILDLIDNNKKREKYGREALVMIQKYWSWNLRATEILEKIN